MRIRKDTCQQILSAYSSVPPEQGGILGMKNGVICEYIHDNSGLETNRAVYVPNIAFLNECIAKWADEGVEFCGMVHSHPSEQKELSSGDYEYIVKIYQFNPQLGILYFPIIVGDHDMMVYIANMVEEKVVIRKDITEIVE